MKAAGMSLTFTRTKPTAGDGTKLIDFLTSNTWPYHYHQHPTVSDVATAVAAGLFDDNDHRSWWINNDEGALIGVARIDNSTRQGYCDLRLAEAWRGRGLGTLALQELTRSAFVSWRHLQAVNAHARADHIAMQRVFERSGWTRGNAEYRSRALTGGMVGELISYRMARSAWQFGQPGAATR